MKEVICIDGNYTAEQILYYNKYKIKTPLKDETYNIRDIIINPDEDPGLLLMEIVNPTIPYKSHLLGDIDIEPNWQVDRFRYVNGNEINVTVLVHEIKVEKRNNENRRFGTNPDKEFRYSGR